MRLTDVVQRAILMLARLGRIPAPRRVRPSGTLARHIFISPF
jgi:hypothetical protein